MGIPVETNLSAILLAIKSKIISSNIFGPDSVYIGLNTNIEVPMPVNADSICVLSPGRQIVDQPVVAGGGNFSMLLEGELQITIFNRLATDEIPRADNWLTDNSLGILNIITRLIQLLQMYVPTNVAGNHLLYTALKLDRINEWRRYENYSKFEANKILRQVETPVWGQVSTDWIIKWWHDVPFVTPTV